MTGEKRLDLKNAHAGGAGRPAGRSRPEWRTCGGAPEWGRLAVFIWSRQDFPCYTGTGMTYLPTGEAYLEDLLERMEQAERFIFMEF